MAQEGKSIDCNFCQDRAGAGHSGQVLFQDSRLEAKLVLSKEGAHPPK
jgi:hypothetical protein